MLLVRKLCCHRQLKLSFSLRHLIWIPFLLQNILKFHDKILLDGYKVMLRPLLKYFAIVGQLLLEGLLGSILKLTWCQLGAILGSKLPQLRSKLPQKSIQRTIKKNDNILDRFLIDFFSIWAPTWGGQGGLSNALLGSFWPLGAILGPR